MEKIITNNEKETIFLGQRLGKICRGGEVFVLSGNLGAGKTKFLQGLAKGLGVKEKVNSPTFNILKLYKIEKNKKALKSRIKVFCHIDAYRLKSEKDLVSLGVSEFLNQPEVVTAIEWGEKVKKIWPKNARIIKIKSLSEKKREIRVK